ncbi:MAG: hypothetical protein LCH53_11895 [Bacteroidetes bacterium]|nr:hypothetical protein [Bacteroidota bacterium]
MSRPFFPDDVAFAQRFLARAGFYRAAIDGDWRAPDCPVPDGAGLEAQRGRNRTVPGARIRAVTTP